MVLLAPLAWFSRHLLNPDGVAYLELAESVAAGHAAGLLQGYWSPGLPLLLAPLARMVQGDRQRLLVMAHAVQAIAAALLLGLGVSAVEQLFAPPARRIVWWAFAWIVIRWLSPVLITPDLLLSACVVWGVLLARRDTPASQWWLGLTVGIGFLIKTSIWPWLGFAMVLALVSAIRDRDVARLKWRALAPAGLIIGIWLALLGVRERGVTLGSVGRLSLEWYLGDLSRRTPDTDHGPHRSKRVVELSSGATGALFEFDEAGPTYPPWSDPESWSRGVPPAARPGFRWAEAVRSWENNAGILLRYLVPLVVALGLIAAAARRGRWPPWPTPYGRSMALVGAGAVGIFVVVHVELRLIAPGVLLCLFGLADQETEVGRTPVPAGLTLAAMALAVGATALHEYGEWPELADRSRNEAQIGAYLEEARPSVKRGVVVTGEAMPVMGTLWTNGLNVVAQLDSAASADLDGLPAADRTAWLRQSFGGAAIGAIAVRTRMTGVVQSSRIEFELWH